MTVELLRMLLLHAFQVHWHLKTHEHLPGLELFTQFEQFDTSQ